eukprot:4291824-Amphidinium_carterae.1
MPNSELTATFGSRKSDAHVSTMNMEPSQGQLVAALSLGVEQHDQWYCVGNNICQRFLMSQLHRKTSVGGSNRSSREVHFIILLSDFIMHAITLKRSGNHNTLFDLNHAGSRFLFRFLRRIGKVHMFVSALSGSGHSLDICTPAHQSQFGLFSVEKK